MHPVVATSFGPAALALPLTLAAGAAALILASAPARSAPASARDERVEMEVLGVVPLEEQEASLLVLKDKRAETILPLAIGQVEAVTIALRLQGLPSPRPLALDLLDQAIAALGGRVAEVEIGTLRESILRGRILLAQGGRRWALDARPSDSIALALGSRAPIYARREVLEDAGVSKGDLDRLRKGRRGERGDSPSAALPL